MRAIGAWEGLIEGLNTQERDDLVLKNIVAEVISSFAIEGVKLSEHEIQNSVVRSMTMRNLGGTEGRSDRIADVMIDARDVTKPLNADRICGWHKALFQGMEVEDLGRWRSFPMLITKSAIAGREDVIYRAVPPERLSQEVEGFFDWLNKSTESLPLKAALAHLYFESIHPFSDGNGRIGRAITEHILAQTGAPSFALSRQIEREKQAYYDALQAGRKIVNDQIDATDFVVWMLGAMTRAMTAAHGEARFSTATRDLVDLREKGILVLAEGRGRSTRYEIVYI